MFTNPENQKQWETYQLELARLEVEKKRLEVEKQRKELGIVVAVNMPVSNQHLWMNNPTDNWWSRDQWRASL